MLSDTRLGVGRRGCRTSGCTGAGAHRYSLNIQCRCAGPVNLGVGRLLGTSIGRVTLGTQGMMKSLAPLVGLLVLLVGQVLVISGDISTGLPVVAFLYSGALIGMLGAVARTDCEVRTRRGLAWCVVVSLTLASGAVLVLLEHRDYQITVVNATGFTVRDVVIMFDDRAVMQAPHLEPGERIILRTRTAAPCGRKWALCGAEALDYESCSNTALGYTETIVLRQRGGPTVEGGWWYERLIWA